MRKQTVFKVLGLLTFTLAFSFQAIAKDLVLPGKHRYIGFLEKKESKMILVLNKKTASPLRIEIDPDKYDGVHSFVGNYIDLDLYFQKACQSERDCKGKILHFNGVHPATVKVPNYIF